jgi:GMP synthase-like glutamine amidotransferase
LKKNILVFKHMTSQNPGIFRDFAGIQNVSFHEIDLHAGDKIPNLEKFDGLWVMGGSMNVWEEEEFPWLIVEKEAIRHALEDLNMPFLGICLGHQLLAVAMGGQAINTGRYEVGLFEIEATQAGLNHPLLNNLNASEKWVNAHLVEVIESPKNSVILATSKACQNHIMQVGENAYSCQFHPEVCSHTLDGWMKIPGVPNFFEELSVNGLEDLTSSITDNLAVNNKASFTLFKNWCDLVFD